MLVLFFACFFIIMLSLRNKSDFALHFNPILFAYYWLNFGQHSGEVVSSVTLQQDGSKDMLER